MGVHPAVGRCLLGWAGLAPAARCTADLQRDTVKQSEHQSNLELGSCFQRGSILGHRELMDTAVRRVDGAMLCKCYSTCRRGTAREITNFHIHYFTGWCVKLQPDNKLLHKNSDNDTSEVLMRTQLLQANISRFAILPQEQRKRMSVCERDLQSTQIL